MPTSYQVHMDLEGFRELFLAQQRSYLRKIGILCAVLCGGLGILGIFLLMDSFDPEMVPQMALLLAVGVFGVVMAVHPFTLLSTRKPVAFRWFYSHGVEHPDATPFAELTADYTVTLGAYGFTEESALYTNNVPWFALAAKPVVGARGTYFVVRKGKESSALYNLMGINWALRNEDVDGVLFVPSDVCNENPELVDSISQHITEARKSVKEQSGTEPGGELSSWLAATGPRQ